MAKRFLLFRRVTAVVVLGSFLLSSLFPSDLVAQQLAAGLPGVSDLPAPGAMVALSGPGQDVLLNGLHVDSFDPFKFQFIADRRPASMGDRSYEAEINKSIRYFLATLVFPETSIWVNLSPYEKDRMLDPGVSETVLGEGLVRQDYLLKQMVSSLLHPDMDLGRSFWSQVYSQMGEKYGTTEVPVETFNKVWIVADYATVYEDQGTAYIKNSRLKVLTDVDYQAYKAGSTELHQQDASLPSLVATDAIREVIIPILEKEVNTGANFANLRQIFHGFILASWYKKSLKNSLLGQHYADHGLTGGVEAADARIAEKVYARYLEAFRTGVFNLIREDRVADEIVPRKYFSGGVGFVDAARYERMPEQFVPAAQAVIDTEVLPINAEKVPSDEIVGTDSDITREDAAQITAVANTGSVQELSSFNFLKVSEAFGAKASAVDSKVMQELVSDQDREVLPGIGQVSVMVVADENKGDLPLGFALDSQTKTIYVSADYLSRVRSGGDLSDNKFVLRKAYAVLHGGSREGIGSIYADVRSGLAHEQEIVQTTFDEFSRDMVVSDDPARTEEYYRALAGQVSGLEKEKLDVVLPSMEMVRGMGRLRTDFKRMLYDITENRLDGITRATTEQFEIAPEELGQYSSVAFIATKLAPPTVVHKLLQTALSAYFGTDISVIDVTALDSRKPSVQWTHATRKRLAALTLEPLKAFVKMIRVQEPELQGFNGEPMSFKLLARLRTAGQQTGKMIKKYVYQAGSDHAGVAGIKGVRDLIGMVTYESAAQFRDGIAPIEENPAAYQDLIASILVLAGPSINIDSETGLLKEGQALPPLVQYLAAHPDSMAARIDKERNRLLEQVGVTSYYLEPGELLDILRQLAADSGLARQVLSEIASELQVVYTDAKEAIIQISAMINTKNEKRVRTALENALTHQLDNKELLQSIGDFDIDQLLDERTRVIARNIVAGTVDVSGLDYRRLNRNLLRVYFGQAGRNLTYSYIGRPKMFWTEGEIRNHARKIGNESGMNATVQQHKRRRDIVGLILETPAEKLSAALAGKREQGNIIDLPYIDTVGLLYMLQRSNPDTQIVFAHTVRPDAMRVDILRDYIINERLLSVANVPLAEVPVAATWTRHSMLRRLLEHTGIVEAEQLAGFRSGSEWDPENIRGVWERVGNGFVRLKDAYLTATKEEVSSYFDGDVESVWPVIAEARLRGKTTIDLGLLASAGDIHTATAVLSEPETMRTILAGAEQGLPAFFPSLWDSRLKEIADVISRKVSETYSIGLEVILTPPVVSGEKFDAGKTRLVFYDDGKPVGRMSFDVRFSFSRDGQIETVPEVSTFELDESARAKIRDVDAFKQRIASVFAGKEWADASMAAPGGVDLGNRDFQMNIEAGRQSPEITDTAMEAVLVRDDFAGLSFRVLGISTLAETPLSMAIGR
jgi:hypothetical protein